ncbi:AAA family ATPase [Proteinivorax hydrogeniformans]|uniref:AAA family ATPase n=1 Tax=Proteinivorax hydrogeniformans TaxID=1826727 RepID=A0AAU8HX21_9FIRM
MDKSKILANVQTGKISPIFALKQLRGSEDITSFSNNKEQLWELDPIKELNQLVGLDNVKSLVTEITAFLSIQKRREEENLLTEPVVMHMIFKGNPGTGKTTVARILGKIFKHLNFLEKGHLVEVERADLVGEYIGHTAQRTKEKISESLGGILFIDEAYSLARGGEKDFGKEAIDTLVKAMEDKKDQFILILAGYSYQMESFLTTNPGLKSRFPIHLNFDDYSIDNLMSIAGMMLKNRQYKMSSKAKLKLFKILKSKEQEDFSNFSNARLVRNIIEKAIRLQAVRLVNKKTLTKEELLTIDEQDIEDI